MVLTNEILILVLKFVLNNFHNKTCCYHEPFHDKVKKIKINGIINGSVTFRYNMKVIITLWTLNCWLHSFFCTDSLNIVHSQAN